jgi:shikimate kinase
MYALRKPMYEAFADFVVDNNASVEDTVSAIIKMRNAL